MTNEEIKFFDTAAERWDIDEVRSTPERVDSILEKLNIKEGDRILDLGCGTGVLTPHLSKRVGPEGSVLGIDISRGMLDRAISKYRHIGNVDFLNLDFEAEELDGEFDVLMLYCVYPHLHHPRKTLARLLDGNLPAGGRIFVAFPSDERFVNDIHKERKAESDMLPSAHELSSKFGEWGLDSRVVVYSPDEYVVEIRKP